MSTRGLGARFKQLGRRGGDARRRGARGAAELSVVVVTGSLVAGVFFGQGLSNTAVDLADGLTWLSDDPSGEVIQVNPATGALQVRQQIGTAGDDIEVAAQYDGHLFVADHTSGKLMSFDLVSMLVSGQRRVSTGGAVQTLVHDGHVFLVDPDQSTIAAIDSQRTDPIGTIWVAPSGLADAAIDAEGTVWAIEDDGTLHTLRWSDDLQEFADDDPTHIELSGPGSVLVAHDRGVTVFGPDQGMVEQVGTDDPRRADAPKLAGKVFAPESAPSDLVPVASADTGTVVILSPTGVREVDMGAVSCDEPGTPEVFHERVYVPCQGEGRVVQLDASGARVDEDIATPGSTDPELVLDDDNLIINTPGADHGVVVRGDGSSGPIVREDATIPVTTPGTTDSPPPPSPQGLLDTLLGDHGKDDHSQPDDQETAQPQPPTSPGADPGSAPGDTSSPGTGTGPGEHGQDHCRKHCTVEGGHQGGTGNGSGNGSGNGGGTSTGNGSGTTDGADPLNAPTNVTARAMNEGQVEISWNHTGFPKPTAFAIRSTGGYEYSRVKSFVRQAIINVTPGESTAFTVTAILADEEATSKPTTAVVTTARPGVPELQGTASYQGDGQQEKFVVTITWSEAAANGAAIMGYDLSVTTPQGSSTRHTDAGTRTATLTWTCDQVADPSCQVGGDYTATVTATNALGPGEPGVLSNTAPAQPPPPLPAGSSQLVYRSSPKKADAGPDGQGQVTLDLRPPNDWSRFPGSCAVVLDGAAGPLACDARTVTLAFDNGPIYEPADGTVSHSVSFTATNPRGTATSASYAFTSMQTPLVLDTGGGGAPQPPPCNQQPCPQIP